jgi:hypothetical protein
MLEGTGLDLGPKTNGLSEQGAHARPNVYCAPQEERPRRIFRHPTVTRERHLCSYLDRSWV